MARFGWVGGCRLKPWTSALTAFGVWMQNMTPLLSLLCASLEGEGTEVSGASQPQAWCMEHRQGAAGRGLSRPIVQSLNMYLR